MNVRILCILDHLLLIPLLDLFFLFLVLFVMIIHTFNMTEEKFWGQGRWWWLGGWIHTCKYCRYFINVTGKCQCYSSCYTKHWTRKLTEISEVDQEHWSLEVKGLIIRVRHKLDVNYESIKTGRLYKYSPILYVQYVHIHCIHYKYKCTHQNRMANETANSLMKYFKNIIRDFS